MPPLPDHDAYLVGTADTLPPAVILDFIYGIAAYRHWRSDKNAHEKQASYFKDHYEPVIKADAPHAYCGQEDTSDDESKDPTYSLPHNTRERGEGRLQEYLNAMDDVLELSLMIRQRTTPEDVLGRIQQ